MKRKSLVKKFVCKVPSWALDYLVNGETSSLDEQGRKTVDEWMDKMREGGRITVCPPEELDAAYFSRSPAFGDYATDVEDCTVIVDRRPKYERCDHPCCGQSRFEPIRRQALDGKWWWLLYDNKEGKFVRGSSRFKTRKTLVRCLFVSWKFEKTGLDYEPDDDRHDLEWLKKQTEIPE